MPSRSVGDWLFGSIGLLLLLAAPAFFVAGAGLMTSYAVRDYRATNGIHGTVTVLDCIRGCRGSFVSDDGSVRLAEVRIYGGPPTPAPGATMKCWVAGPDATRAYASRRWPVFVVSTALFLLVAALLVVVTLTSGRRMWRARRRALL